jgi:hypothetical protein
VTTDDGSATHVVKDRGSPPGLTEGARPHRRRLIELSNSLHDDPELGWQEFRSSAAVAEVLAEHGFTVERPYLGLETAFRATYGSGEFTIGFLAEYDALPGLGHACGHNLIAAMSVGGAIGLAEAAAELGITVEVIGTPAEEGGGGKIELLDRGAFTELDFALMAHPAPVDVAEAEPFAVTHWHVEYTGRAAHAAAYPERGINANDAFLVAQSGPRPAPPAAAEDRTSARGDDERRRGSQRDPGEDRGPLVRARRDDRRTAGPSRRRSSTASKQGPWPPGPN